jgi:hypothetical protein
MKLSVETETSLLEADTDITGRSAAIGD